MNTPFKDRLFQFLSAHYVQRADDRHKEMGLQYTTAETHDLTEQIVKFLSTSVLPRERYDELLRAERKLHALEAAGVDNWDHYGEAIAELNEDEQ